MVWMWSFERCAFVLGQDRTGEIDVVGVMERSEGAYEKVGGLMRVMRHRVRRVLLCFEG